MGDERTTGIVAATIVAAALSGIGVWLPWVRKDPVGYTDGQPEYTQEYVAGLESGLTGIDWFVILLVSTLVLMVAASRFRNWRPDLALICAGVLILLAFGNTIRDYRSVDRYVVEPGLYIILASGLLFVLIGAYVFLKQYHSTNTNQSRDSELV